MKIYLNQKVFSFRDRFYVKDENGNDKYAVEGQILSLGKKLHIFNSDGTEAAFIYQKLLSWLPRYYIEIDGCVVCEIVKEFTFFKPSYRLEGVNWRLDGNMWGHEYSLHDNGQIVMQLSKKWLTWGDAYELDITNPKDELLCLCVSLAVDCVLAAQND